MPARERALTTREAPIASTLLGLSDVEREELRLQALELRRDRMSYKKIGVALGISEFSAYHLVKERIAEIIEEQREDASEIIQLELEELDYLQQCVLPGCADGEIQAIQTALKISESRRRLMGLDKPNSLKVEVSTREFIGIDVDRV